MEDEETQTLPAEMIGVDPALPEGTMVVVKPDGTHVATMTNIGDQRVPANVRLQVIAGMLAQGLDISAEGARMRATLYQDSVILSHPVCLLIACVHCGKLKEGYGINDGEMDRAVFDHLSSCINQLPRCTCQGKALKEELVQEVLQRLSQEIRLQVGAISINDYLGGKQG